MTTRLGGSDQRFVLCRDLGHSWRYVNDAVTRGTRGKPVEFTRVLRCMNCEAEAHDTYEVPSFARKGSRRMVYPENFLIKGSGRIKPAEARREMYERLQG